MRTVRQLLLACVLAAVLGAFGSATALASNCGGAGNQQYIDPLQCGGGGGGGTPSNGHPTTGRSTGTTSTQTTTPTTTTTTGTSSGSASDTSTTTSTPSSTSTSKSDPKSSKTLPYTGLDLGPALLLAFGLVGGGFVLRRIVAD